MKRALQLRIMVPSERIPELYQATRLTARAMTLAMQLERTADAERPTSMPTEPPKKGDKVDWKAIFGSPENTYTYPRIRAAYPMLESTITSGICQIARKTYRSHRVEILLGKRRTPEWRKDHPIPIHGQRWKLTWNGDDFIMRCQLWSKDANKSPFEAVVLSRRLPEEYRKVLDDLASGKIKQPRILIHLGRSRKRTKWFIDVPYDVPDVDVSLSDDRTLFVRRPNDGNGFLRCVLEQAQRAPRIEELEWTSALRAKKQIAIRRNGIAAKYRSDADCGGRHGHGRARVLRTSHRMSRRSMDQQRDYNYKRARHIVDTAVRWKCTRIDLENLSLVPKPETLVLGHWNYFQLNERVKLLCEQHGIECRLVKPVEVLEKELEDND